MRGFSNHKNTIMKTTGQRISHKNGVELLKNGHSLTAAGKNLDTLSVNEDGEIQYVGMCDQAPTIFDNFDQIKFLFKSRRWVIDMI